MDGMDSTDYQDITGGTGYDTSVPVDTSNTPATGAPSAPSGGWTGAQSLAAFNNLLGTALTADAINHGKTLPTAYGTTSTLVPVASAKRQNNMVLLLLVIGVFVLLKEEKK